MDPMVLFTDQHFAVSNTLRSQVWYWAQDVGIRIEFGGTLTDNDVWRVVDPEDCVMFKLRWA